MLHVGGAHPFPRTPTMPALTSVPPQQFCTMYEAVHTAIYLDDIEDWKEEWNQRRHVVQLHLLLIKSLQFSAQANYHAYLPDGECGGAGSANVIGIHTFLSRPSTFKLHTSILSLCLLSE